VLRCPGRGFDTRSALRLCAKWDHSSASSIDVITPFARRYKNERIGCAIFVSRTLATTVDPPIEGNFNPLISVVGCTAPMPRLKKPWNEKCVMSFSFAVNIPYPNGIEIATRKK
jgi:hypothetical protein